MKALRKCACVTVQLVVTAALLFQQCPVQAIALGLEQGSDYVEIPASEEGTGAENDSSDASSNDGNSNEAAPASPEKDEAEAASSSLVEGSQGVYESIARRAEDDGCYLDSRDESLETSDLIAPWTKCGLCEWMIDSNGTLIIRPRNNLASAELENYTKAPWREYSDSITSISVEKGVIATGSTTNRMFYGLSNVTNADLSGLDTSKATDMSYMFYGFGKGLTLDLTSFETGNVTIMRGMFQNSRIVGIEFSSFDTSHVTDMERMFYESRSIRSLDLTSFYVPELLSMKEMFYGCSQLESVKFGNLKARSLKSLESTFRDCNKLESVSLGSLGQTRVWCLKDTFKDCEALKCVDLCGFSSPVLETIEYVCCGDKKLTTFLMPGAFPSELKSSYHAFSGCSSLETLDISGLTFSSKNYTDNAYMFRSVDLLKRISVGNGFSVYRSQSDETFCTPGNSELFTGKWVNLANGHSYRALDEIKGDGGTYIWQKELTPATVSVDTSSVVYDGSEHKKKIVSDLIEGEDYICEYDSNVNAGEAHLQVIGQGSCIGQSVSFTFAIEKAVPTYEAPVPIDCAFGEALEDIDLPNGFSWEGNVKRRILEVGEIASFTVKYTPADSANYKTVHGIPVILKSEKRLKPSLFSIDLSGPYIYTGGEIRPSVTSPVLTEGTDYQVAFVNNVNVGNARIVVTGCGSYSGQSIDYSFAIEPSLPSYKLPTGVKASYGQKLSDVKLPEGFSWEDPSLSVGDPGENAFKCNYAAPDGNHTGADGIEVEVRVTRPVEASMFSVDAKGLAYTGKAHEPAVSSKVVPADSFSVSYRDNVAAGKAVAVVKGSGFYTGTCEVPFTIAKAKPSYEAPTGLKAAYGQRLSDVKLPEGFSWEDSDARVDWYGSKAMKAVFVPSDAENYEVVKGIEIPVFVGRKVISVPSIDDLVYSGSIQLPQVDIDGVRVVSNDGGIDAGKYSVELALDDPKLDCWEDGSVGNKTVEYKIVPADINTADIAPISPCLLKDGKAEPGVSVTFGGRKLSVGHDFSVSYSDNEKVGTASATIEGKGNFTGGKTAYFQIAKSDLGDCLVATKRNVYLYKGDTVEPRIFVSFGDASLREGVDYKVAYSGNDAVGIGHAIVSGMGEYIGSKTVDFAIVDAIDLGTYCTVHAYDAFYTGDKVCPRVDVRLNTESSDEAYGNGGASRSEDAPVEGRDYTVLFEDNVNPGMGTAIVQGRGRYTGEVRVQFHILRKSDFDLSDCSVLLDPPSNADRYSYALKGGKYSFLYTGSAIEPTVSVSLYNDSGVYVELRNGVDYEVSYRSNTEPGSASVVVRGINGLTGSQTIGFNIVRKLSVADLSLSKYDFEQSVYQLKPGFALAPKLRRSSSFVEGADYILSYANCDKVGNGLVTVTGIGRYTGSVVVEVPIVESLDRSLLSECSFDKIEDQVYTGSEIYPSVVLRNASGAEVDQARECSLHYSNNVNVGKATVSACESMYYSSYIGETSTSFNILPADIDDAYFAPIGDEIYTGNAIKPDVLVRFNGKTLVKGIDYDLSYSDNVEVGTAHVVVTGKGNFGGKREMTFNIVRPVIEFDQDMVEGKTVSTRWTSKVNTTNYRIVLDRGGMVRIRTGFLGIDTVLCSIRNENGDPIDAWAPSDGMVYGFFALPAGTYYFEYVGSPKAYGGSVYASYSVTRFGEPANTIYEAEDNNGTADGHTIAGDATPVEVGRFFAGSNYYATTGGFGDIDYFKFTVVRRGRYSMSLATSARLMFALTDAQGNILNNRDTGSSIVAQSGTEQLAGLDFGTLEPGTYYVRVLSTDRAAVGSPYYGFIFDSSEPESAERGVGRVSGDTRYDTMASLVGRGNWAVGGSVILASGANYPDALAASSLAGGLDAPILLTDPNGLSDAAKGRLESLCPSRVFIVGGNAAVSPDVERQIKEMLGSGCAVFRVAGQTRYETSLVAAEINPKSSDTVIVATGGNYADALSVSPYAFASGSPVLLCDSASGLAGAAVESIRSGGYSRAVIVGGTAAVPASVEGQLQSAGIRDVTRLSGATRFETSSRIADFELASGLGFSMDGVLLATGMNFPDALSAGPLAGRSRSPLLLVDPGAEYACAYLSWFRGEVSSATVVGGTAAVPEEDRLAIAGVLGI